MFYDELLTELTRRWGPPSFGSEAFVQWLRPHGALQLWRETLRLNANFNAGRHPLNGAQKSIPLTDATPELVEAGARSLEAFLEDPRCLAEGIAQRFHEAYEALAPEHGYRTREASSVPWAQVPAANKTLMVATVMRLLVTGTIVPGDPLK